MECNHMNYYVIINYISQYYTYMPSCPLLGRLVALLLVYLFI